MNREQLDRLADMVRTTPDCSHSAIVWAVKHHLALFYNGLESAEETLDSLLKACNTNRDDGIVNRIGLKALEPMRGKHFAKLSTYSEHTFIQSEEEA